VVLIWYLPCGHELRAEWGFGYWTFQLSLLHCVVMSSKVFFGDLESAIMDIMWRWGSQTVRAVLPHLRRKVAYTTVMTVMNRLVEQGALRRRMGERGAFVYAATRSLEEQSADATKTSLQRLVRQYGDAALVQFIEVLDTIPAEKLAKLRQRGRK
jgi:predicted transcriptional regulator